MAHVSFACKAPSPLVASCLAAFLAVRFGSGLSRDAYGNNLCLNLIKISFLGGLRHEEGA
jgi:hypothetical protein